MEMEDEEIQDCQACNGTGIGMFSDPDTSKCSVCNGTGVKPASKQWLFDNEFYD